MAKRTVLMLVAALPAVALAAPPKSTEWITRQEVDRMTDVRKCMVRAKDEDVTPIFLFRSDGQWLFVVSNSDFPGRTVRARVDKNAALTGEEDLSSTQDKQLFKQIRAGGAKLLTESYAWPDDYPVVREFTLAGLVSILGECENWVRSGDPPQNTE